MKSVPLYQYIYDSLTQRIKDGEFDGKSLPSEEKLSQIYNVSRITSKRALNMLAENNIIHRVQGRGSFLIDDKNFPFHINKKKIGSKNVTIAVVMCEIGSSFGMDVLRGLESKASSYGVNLVFARSLDSAEKEIEVINRLIQNEVNGLIVQPVHGKSFNETIMKLVIDNFPIVLIDREMNGLDVSYVGTNNHKAVCDTVRNLIRENKYKAISYVYYKSPGTSSIEERTRGFQNAFIKENVFHDNNLNFIDLLSPLPENKTPELINGDIEKLEKHILSHPEIDCIFACEVYVAKLIDQALINLKNKLKKNIRLISFDNDSGSLFRPYFTHVSQNQFEMGVKAVELLMELINDEKKTNEKIYLDVDFVEGET